MLDSLYERALEKRKNINEKLEDDIRNIKIDPDDFWIEWPINEDNSDFTIAGEDGSFNQKEFMGFVVYALDAECLIYNGEDLEKVQSFDIDIINPYRYIRDRLRNYMSIFEVKNSLNALEEFDVDLFLFDGSIMGNIIRPFPLEYALPSQIKEELKTEFLPVLEKALKNKKVEITSSHLFNSIREDFGGYETESMIYLENLENLVSISMLLNQIRDIVAISKTSTSTDYFRSNIPDIAIFERFKKKQGYSKPRYTEISKIVKRDFPILDSFFRGLDFTIFYVRLDDFKNVLKFEIPYRLSEPKIGDILEKIKSVSTEGYPYLLKKAHNDVIIRNRDMEMLTKIVGFMERSGREML